MSFHRALVSFNAGEASPFVRSRSDLEKYPALCQRLENFLILPYGGVLRRPGTEYMGNPKFSNRRCRMIGFNFSTTTNFILEFGHEYVRFWSNDQQVLKSTAPAWLTATPYTAGNYVLQTAIIYFCLVAHTSGTFATDLANGRWIAQSIVEVPTPFQEADLREIQYCQINDILYVVHPSYYPSKLSRLADDSWSWENIAWKFPPTLDLHDGDITITPSSDTGAVTLTASAALFSATDVGGWWIIGHSRSGSGNNYIQVNLDATDETTNDIKVLGSWEFTTYGNWQGTVIIERQLLDTTQWEQVRTYRSTNDGERNVSASGIEEKLCKMRLVWDGEGVAGTVDPVGRLEIGETRYYGVIQITGFTSTTVVNATVMADLWSADATRIWAEAAFSTKQGFARAISLHDSRLVLAGTRMKPLRIYGSFIDDFENFRTGSRADESFVFGLAANESNPINWLVSQQGRLLIGNAGEEWTLERTDQDEALSPINVSATRQSSYGSAYVQAKLINEVILFVQRQGTKIRELTFAFEKDGWVAPDLTILAQHITGDGVVETAFQQQPDAVFWIITSDGRLAGMTYERDQNVVGWHPHNTDGEFESVGTIYGGSGADEVWFLVNRTISGVTARYIERLHPSHRNEFEDADKAAWFYLDCALRSIVGSPSTSVTGLAHLEGKTVSILADGAIQPDQVVSGGAITLDYAASNVLVGLSYTSVLKPMNLEIPLQDGSTKSRKARVHRVAIEVYKSLGCEVSPDEVAWDEVFFRAIGHEMDASPPVFTGKKKVSLGGSYEDFAELTLRTSKPMPLCILSLTPILDFFGNE